MQHRGKIPALASLGREGREEKVRCGRGLAWISAFAEMTFVEWNAHPTAVTAATLGIHAREPCAAQGGASLPLSEVEAGRALLLAPFLDADSFTTGKIPALASLGREGREEKVRCGRGLAWISAFAEMTFVEWNAHPTAVTAATLGIHAREPCAAQGGASLPLSEVEAGRALLLAPFLDADSFTTGKIPALASLGREGREEKVRCGRGLAWISAFAEMTFVDGMRTRVSQTSRLSRR